MYFWISLRGNQFPTETPFINLDNVLSVILPSNTHTSFIGEFYVY